MKIKVIISIITCIFFSIYCIRIAHISKNDFYPKTITYNFGTEVDFEKDFFYNIQDSATNYSIIVLDKELMDREKFISIYNIDEKDVPAFFSHIFLVKARFHNNNDVINQQSGVDLSHFILQESECMTFAYKDIIPTINNINTYAFSLMPNNDEELLIPFFINPEYISPERLLKGNPSLVITLYPNKKCILLNNKA